MNEFKREENIGRNAKPVRQEGKDLYNEEENKINQLN